MVKTRRKSIAVNNIADLRRHALNTLAMLTDGEIEIEDAKAASDLYNNVLGILRAEVEYHKTTGKQKDIAFFDGVESAIPVVDVEQVAKLENKWKGA